MTPQFRTTLAVLLLAALMLGCAVTPQSPSEGVAAAYTTIETLAESVETAREAGYISDDDAMDARDRLLTAHKLAVGAQRAIAEGKADEAGDMLSRARSVLSVVRDTVEGIR